MIGAPSIPTSPQRWQPGAVAADAATALVELADGVERDGGHLVISTGFAR